MLAGNNRRVKQLTSNMRSSLLIIGSEDQKGDCRCHLCAPELARSTGGFMVCVLPSRLSPRGQKQHLMFFMIQATSTVPAPF